MVAPSAQAPAFTSKGPARGWHGPGSDYHPAAAVTIERLRLGLNPQ